MRSIYLHLVIYVITFSCISCSKKDSQQSGCEPLGKDCQQIICGKSEASVCYVKTLSDSRCPAGAVCIWQGKADVELSLVKDGNSILFRLSTQGVPGSYPNDTVIQNIHIRLKQVLPYPGLPGGPPGVEVSLSCR
ncbi:MAG TPA: hypothetical protein VEY10_10975 [Flavisolibacter sp.]|nr:hypothetical protein [Flavisolibacter sp.]